MNTYIALLRGVNVGGRNRVKMADLKICLEALGLSDITTYIQSGNIVFQSSALDCGMLQRQIQKGIQDRYGFEVLVLVLTISELQSIDQQNPFIVQEDTDTKALHYTIVSEAPDASVLETLHAYEKNSESFIAIRNVLYLRLPDGYGRTKLNTTFFERHLGCSATTRNHNTIRKLILIGTTQY